MRARAPYGGNRPTTHPFWSSSGVAKAHERLLRETRKGCVSRRSSSARRGPQAVRGPTKGRIETQHDHRPQPGLDTSAVRRDYSTDGCYSPGLRAKLALWHIGCLSSGWKRLARMLRQFKHAATSSSIGRTATLISSEASKCFPSTKKLAHGACAPTILYGGNCSVADVCLPPPE